MTNGSAKPPRERNASVPALAWALLAVTIGLVVAQFYGRGAFFLVVAGAALLTAVFILWNSVQALTGDAPLTLEEALTLTAPSTEEERKVAVLRALKDLEYERSVGKLSEDDYLELTRKYRQEAKQLLQAVDESMAEGRQRALALLAERMEQAPADAAPVNHNNDQAPTSTRDQAEPRSARPEAPAAETPTAEAPTAETPTAEVRVDEPLSTGASNVQRALENSDKDQTS